MQSDEIKDKVRQTILEKYGVENINQQRFSDETKQLLFDRIAFTNLMQGNSIFQAAKKLGVCKATIMRYIEKYNVIDYLPSKRSYLETEMSEFLIENNLNFIQNDRKVISPLELDFFLPDYNLAIEMNGTYWHSDEFLLEAKNMTANEYHQMKTDMCSLNGVKLIHISENEWNSKSENIKKTITTLITYS